MTTLTTPPLAPMLNRLFAEAAATDEALRQQMAQLTPAERDALLSNTDYRSSYARVKDCYLAVSRETGRLCYMLARSSRARSIVEFGTSLGISTLHLAAAVRDNGGGRVISTEFEPSKVARAREYMTAGGVADLVDIREGDALQTLARDLPESVDLVLLDGAKQLYSDVLRLIEPKLRVGALVIADNADLVPEYVEQMHAPNSGYLSVRCANDVELSIRL